MLALALSFQPPPYLQTPFIVVVGLGLGYLGLFTVLSHVGQRAPEVGASPFFVFVVPCLNEELVIGRCLDKLLAMPSKDFAILVIDDGSDDDTAANVEGYDPNRVWLLKRVPPEARQGKGAALNAAYRHLWESELLAGRDPHEVVVAVVDADGRLQPDALETVAPYFERADVGAVQVGVRMYNAHESTLARMQDVEFVVFTELYQRARRHIGSVGLGGNGQFVRLAALRSLEQSPWTDCLTEDLDLGIRLRLHGWFSEYTGRTWVEQQAVTNLPRLIRQRARWFQGHLQCNRLIPTILRARLPLHTTLDLCWHLLGPVTILLMSVWSGMFLTTLAYLWLTDPAGSWQTTIGHPWILPSFYLLSVAPAVLYGFVYRRQTRSLPLVKVAFLSHLFIAYGYLWFLAGWRALWQIGTGKRGWAKTARTAEPAAAGERRRGAGSSWKLVTTGLAGGFAGTLLAFMVLYQVQEVGSRDAAAAEPAIVAAAGAGPVQPVPAGWRPCRQPVTGARIAVPASWRSFRDETGQVGCHDPATGASVRVRQSPAPLGGPLASPLQAEVTHRWPGYHRIRLEATAVGGAPAASWEFLYRGGRSRMHAADLHVISGGMLYVVEVRSPAGSWSRTQPLVDPIWTSLDLDA
jgi:1,2-diacylglycerol 3-beta-glucosyltransferase